jgi:hypothetical protein
MDADKAKACEFLVKAGVTAARAEEIVAHLPQKAIDDFASPPVEPAALDALCSHVRKCFDKKHLAMIEKLHGEALVPYYFNQYDENAGPWCMLDLALCARYREKYGDGGAYARLGSLWYLQIKESG